VEKIKALAKQTVWYGLSSMIGRFLFFILTPLHTLALGTSNYGNTTKLYSYLAIFQVFLMFGLETGFFRFSNKYKEKFRIIYSTAFWFVLLSASLFLFFTLQFDKSLISFLEIGKHSFLFYITIFILFFDIINALPFAKLRLENRPVKYALINVISIVISVLINIFFLWICRVAFNTNPDSFFGSLYNPDHVLLYVFGANLVMSLIKSILLYREFLGLKITFSIRYFIEMFKYSFPILLVGLFGAFNDNVEKILIPELINAEDPVSELGIYGANFKLSVLMVLFIQMFRYAAEPFFFSNAKDKNSKTLYADVMKYFIIVGLIIFMGVTFYIDIFKYFIAEPFWAGLSIVPILLIAKLFYGIFFSLSVWYKVSDHTRFGAITAFIGFILTIVLNLLLIPKFGYFGSAIAMLTCYVVMVSLSYLFSIKYFKIPYDFKRILFYFVLTSILYVINSYIPEIHFLIQYIISGFLILVFIFVVYQKEFKNLIRYKHES